MAHERLKLSFSVIATAILFGAGAAHAAPVENISEFFSPQGEKVTAATYPTA